ncbi:hypothetical protein GIB67_005376 [Kingdonia uniflora]|uniref:Cytochrome P450 n=1 Tax=Kingdonia uniflora TaxID=39325 RepID=A0A7J7NHM3_9MAGN|nr:hypothetical protein GIB67_005376 [Kingdonia uniflora]
MIFLTKLPPDYETSRTVDIVIQATGYQSFLIVYDPSIAKHIFRENSKAYSKGILAEILEFVMGKGLIPADGEIWRVRRRPIVPALHKKVIQLFPTELFSRFFLEVMGTFEIEHPLNLRFRLGIERERQRELQGLLEHRAVSDFAHRNRIQVDSCEMKALRPPSIAARELGLLRQRHTVSGLRSESYTEDLEEALTCLLCYSKVLRRDRRHTRIVPTYRKCYLVG